METWKVINERYEVSSLGNVRSTNYKNTGETRELKLQTCHNGYNNVMLGYGRRVKVHRLVAQAFLGLNIEDKKMTVNHIDEVKTNNSLDNLELCSIRENIIKYNESRRELPTYVRKYRGKYQVAVNHGNYRKGDTEHCKLFLGSYSTVEEAKSIVDEYWLDMEAYKDLIVE